MQRGAILLPLLISCATAAVLADDSLFAFDLLFAIRRVVRFVRDHPQETLADLLIGIALAEGQIKVLRQLLEDDTYAVRLSDSERRKMMVLLKEIEKELDKFSEEAEENLILRTDDYNTMVTKLIRAEKWEVAHPLRYLTPPADYIDPRNASRRSLLHFNLFGGPRGEASDLCLGEAVAARGPSCPVSPLCRAEIFAGRSHGYPLTHRLLYVIAARQHGGCEEILGHPVEELTTQFCSEILVDNIFLEDVGLPIFEHDLFAEQVALCGLEGFLDFLSRDKMMKILSWQRPEGCFGDTGEMNRSLQGRRRRKRSSMPMAYGCIMHFTATATAALAVGLRAMIEV